MPCMGTSVKESDKRKEAAERRRKQMQLMQEANKKKKETKNEEEEEERERQKEAEQRKHQDKNNTQTEKTLKDSKYENKKNSTNTSKVSAKRSTSPPSSSLSPQRLPILVHEESYYSNIAESRSSKERNEAKRKGEECNSHVSSTVNNSTATDASAVIDGKDNTEKNNLHSSEKSNSKDVETNVISNLENPVERERLMQQMLQQALQLNEMLEHELQDARQKLKDTPANTNSSSLSSSYSSALIHKPHKEKLQRKDDNNKKHKLSSQGQAQTPRVTICETPSQRSLSAKRENSKQLDKMDNNNINNSSKNKNTNATTTTTKGENDPEALLQRAIEEKWSNDEILCKAREAVKHCPPKEAMNTLQILRDVYLLRHKHMTHALERDARKRELSNINKNNKDVHLHSPRALSYPAGPQNGTLHYNSNKDKKNNNKESDKIKNNYCNNNNNNSKIVNDKYYYYQSRPVEPRRGRIANDYENKKQTNWNEKSYYRSQSAYLPRNSYRNDDAQYLTNKRYEPRYENVHYPRNFHNPYHHRHHHHHSSSSSRPHYRDNNNNNNLSFSNNYQKYGEDKYTSPSSPYRRYHSEPRQRRSYDDLLQLHSPSYRNNTMSTKYNNGNNAYRPNAHAPAAAEKFHRTTHLPHGYELDKNTNIDDNKIVNAPYIVRGRLSASQTDIIAALENGYVSQAKRVLAWLEQKVNEESLVH